MDHEKNFMIKKKEAGQFNLMENIIHARKSGKSLFSQVKDIYWLSRGRGELTPEEYYYYRLYDDNLFSLTDKRKFVGHRAQNKIIKIINKKIGYWGIAEDKLVFYILLKSLGLSTVDIIGLYHPSRYVRTIPLIKNAEELSTFLKTKINYPFFSKPVNGIFSQGTAYVCNYEPISDSLVLGSGERIKIDRFIHEIEDYKKEGYIFQQGLQNHPELKEICGDRISSVRLVIIAEKKPKIMWAAWKIITGKNIVDNFWRKGNLLANVHIENGVVDRVIQGAGMDQRELEIHPDTERQIKGVVLPHWASIKQLCLKAAAALPWIKLQAWDVAICSHGPVLLEVNIGGDFNLTQIASGKGVLNKFFAGFIDQCAKT